MLNSLFSLNVVVDLAKYDDVGLLWIQEAQALNNRHELKEKMLVFCTYIGKIETGIIGIWVYSRKQGAYIILFKC